MTVGLNSTFVKETHYLGISYWAQWMQLARSRFTVLEYIGRYPDSGLFVFRDRNHSYLIYKRLEELYTHDFKPFLINLERVTCD